MDEPTNPELLPLPPLLPPPTGSPLASTHCPFLHPPPTTVQTLPQLPQLNALVWRSVQPPWHMVWPCGHVHVPFTHVDPIVQKF